MVNWSTLLLASFGRGPPCVSLLKSFQIAHNVMSVLSLVCGDRKSESGVVWCSVDTIGHVEKRWRVLSGA